MSNIPLVRRAIAGAAMAHSSGSNEVESSPLGPPEESHWTPAALERAGSTLKALNRMAKRPPVHIIFEDIGYTVGSRKGKMFNITILIKIVFVINIIRIFKDLANEYYNKYSNIK